MSKSKARFLAELLSSDGKVIKTKSQASTIIVSDLPTIPNSKLANSSVTIAGEGLSLGASLTLDTGDVTEHTAYKYYTDARARASISATGSLSYNSTTGVMSFTMPAQNTSNITEGSNLYFTNARADARIVNAGSANWNTAYSWGNHASAGYTTTDTTYSVQDGELSQNNFTNADHSKLDGIAASANNYSHPSNHAINVITGLQTALNAKVDDSQVLTNVPANAVFTDTNTTYSVGDGGLSQNNFTNADHSKLDGIATGATNTAAPHYTSAIAVGAGGLTQQNFTTTLKNKLDGIAASANNYVLPFTNNSSNWNTAYGWGNHASAGYTNDQTAAEILAALKTVDVNGTAGVNAGTVDGIASSRIIYGANASGTGEGTFSDWNAVTKSGFYSHSGASNKWSTANWSSILHTKLYNSNNSYATQLGFDTYNNNLYTRTNNNGTWTSWAEIWHAGVDGSGSGLDADLLDGQEGSYYRAYANLTGTPTIPSLSGYATESYVGTQISNLVDSSPAALNTLNELAAAIGDDASFSTTVTNNIATKLPKAGGALTGAVTTNSTFDGRNVSVDGTKLDTIATSANNYSFPYTVSASESNSTVVQRHPSGYIYANYYNGSGTFSTSGANSGMGIFTGTNGSDTFGRSYSATGARALLNVENGATADQTAAEILTAIKTVDGSGSGLDADLLDGQHGTYYANEDARKSVPSSGNYQISNATAPATLGAGYLRHDFVNSSGGPPGSNYRSVLGISSYTGSNQWSQLSFNYNQGINTPIYFRQNQYNGSTWSSWHQLWDSANDGSGSGLDADLLDGQHGSYYYQASNPSGYTTNTGTLTAETLSATNTVNVTGTKYFQPAGTATSPLGGSGGASLQAYTTGTTAAYMAFHRSGAYAINWGLDTSNAMVLGGWSSSTTAARMSIGTNGLMVTAGQGILWGAGNDGSGSGLDADLLDGQQGSYYAAASALSSKVHTSGNTGLGATWKTTFYSGSGGATFGANHYSMGVDVANGSWSGPNYSDLIIGYHTGIRIGAAYGGTKFYNNSPTTDTNNDGEGEGTEALLMTVGGVNGGSGVKIQNALIIAGAGTQQTIDTTTHSLEIKNSGSTGAGGLVLQGSSGTHGLQMYFDSSGYGFLDGPWANWDIQKIPSGTFKVDEGSGLQRVWNAGNDGAGSGLDADLLDGQQGSYYYPASNPNGYTTNTGTLTATNDRIYITDTRGANRAPSYYDDRYVQADFTQNAYLGVSGGDSWGTALTVSKWASYDASHRQEQLIFAGTKLARRVATSDSAWSSAHTIWDSSTDGSGSGLDADLLDGQQPSASGGANKIAQYATNGYLYPNNWIHPNNGTGLFYSAGVHFYEVGNKMYSSTSYTSAVQGTLWGSSNDGSGSGLDADLLDGLELHTGRNDNANKVVRTQVNGYCDLGWINTTSGVASGTPTRIYCSQDAYIRYYTPASLAPYILNQGSTKNSHTHPVSSITAGTFTGTFTMGTQLALVANNYGRGLFGVYSASRYQHVWSMGTAYKTSDDGTSYGNMYGLTYTHTNIGTGTNQSISGLSHQLQHRQNGVLNCAFGAGIWTSGNVTAYSDIAVKTNLVRIPNALEKVCSINGYTYERTDYVKDLEDPEAPDVLRQAGVVAQEIEKVLPEVVSGNEGNKAVAYGNIVALLIESIKELKDEVDELKRQLEDK